MNFLPARHVMQSKKYSVHALTMLGVRKKETEAIILSISFQVEYEKLKVGDLQFVESNGSYYCLPSPPHLSALKTHSLRIRRSRQNCVTHPYCRSWVERRIVEGVVDR